MFDTNLVNRFVDANVAHHCLKLLVMILTAQTREGPAKISKYDQQNLLNTLQSRQCALVVNLISFMKDSDTDPKMVKLLEFILSKIEILASSNSDIARIIQDSKPQNKLLSQTADADDQNAKMEKQKQKQNKLLQKMKNKGKKMLQKKQESAQVASKEEINCAFCQEVLCESNFNQNHYGRFAYV